MRQKKKDRLAEIKLKRKIRERDSEDEEEERAMKKKQREANKPVNTALNFNLPIPSWENVTPIVKDCWNGAPGQAEPSEELKLQRKTLGVLVKGNTARCPPPLNTIQDAGVPKLFQNYFQQKGMSEPTVVQKQCWPALLNGVNVLGIAPTGSGKTLAYALPAVIHIQSQPVLKLTSNRIQPMVLILVPTRELAIQVQAVLKAFKGLASITTGLLYGGQDKEKQLDDLRNMGNLLKLLVATPGRLIDLMGSKDKPLDLTKVTYQVIDEADRMLSLGFAEQLDAIAKQLRPDRQVVLFSATFPGRLRELSEQWASEAIVVRCNTMEVKDFHKEKASVVSDIISAQPTEEQARSEPKQEKDKNVKKQKDELVQQPSSSSSTAAPADDEEDEGDVEDADEEAEEEQDATADAVPAAKRSNRQSSITVSQSIKQHIHICAAHKRPRLLIKFVERTRAEEKAQNLRQAHPMIIFCNKIKTLKFVVNFLNKENYKAVPLHGQLHQQMREDNLNSFKSGKVNIVVATDVAARGIHIRRLKYVVNYDFPANIEQYCHRIGRCGRQGEEGEAYSLMTRNFAVMASDLIELVKSCNQVPEPNLVRLATEYSMGQVVINEDEEQVGDASDDIDNRPHVEEDDNEDEDEDEAEN